MMKKFLNGDVSLAALAAFTALAALAFFPLG